MVIDGHEETMFLRDTAFRQWLNQQFYKHMGSAPRSDAMRGALDTLDAKFHSGLIAEVHTRVAEKDGKLYLDLCDEKWRVVEVTALGWSIVQKPPVFFRRAPGMTALPVPKAGGSIELLRPFLNVASDSDFVLVVCWILACFRSSGPYPVLVLTGEHGSAKSSFTRNVRSLVDPNAVGLRSLPRDERDLFIAASNGHVIAFDNVSDLPDWLSDTLCRLATGGGFATRQLFSDQGEVLIDAIRPIVLNGIGEVVTRPDLSDRALFVHLPPIADDKRRPEAELNAEFEAVRPRILGALLDAVAHGLKRLPETHLERSPRMADFARWATACEGALWPPGTFWAAYNANRSDAVVNVIEGNLVAAAVRDFMATRTLRTVWTGTATDLLREINAFMGYETKHPKDWPTSPAILSNKLHLVETDLRKIGIEIEYKKEGRKRTRMISIYDKTAKTPSASSAPSTPSTPPAGRPPIADYDDKPPPGDFEAFEAREYGA